MQKIKNKTWKASNGFVPQTPKIYFVILVGKLRVCRTNPKTSFCLACLEGNFPSTFSVASLDCWVEIKKAIVIKRLLFCYLFYYLFCGLLFLKSSKRFFKSSLFSVSMSVSSTFLLLNQSGNVSFLGS